jgi:NhaA family Na+:H+ antiporter
MKPRFTLRDFLKQEGSSGFLLMSAATLGLVLANSPIADQYKNILSAGFKIDSSYFYLSLTTAKVINYFLMSIFFLVVGMEIKRELLSGHLSSLKKAAAPFAAAIGGMFVPAIIFISIVSGEGRSGWAIPVATDIALAIGVLTLMGSRVNFAMKAFLLALAVIDDIGAIAIIAVFYSKNLGIAWLLSGVGIFILIYLVLKMGYNSKMLTIALALVLWYCFYRAGIHPTLAGVLLGFALPESIELEHKLHPWSSYLIIPLFALANTGVVISNTAISNALKSEVALGIFMGMVIGKPLGIYLFTKVAEKVGIAEAPIQNGKFSMLATGNAAGIGFTVAIFISELAFTDPNLQAIAIITVIAASITSGLLSIFFHRLSPISSDY